MRNLSAIQLFRVLAIILVIALFIPPGLAVPAAVKGEPKIQVAPVNPSFQAYQSGAKADQTTKVNGKLKGLGYIPSPVDKSQLKGKKIKAQNGVVSAYEGTTQGSGSDVVSFPAAFDLRTLGRVSPVKDQGQCGSCWAFATYGSGESTLLPAQLYDFSENNLKNTAGFDLGPCSGGNADMSAAYLTRWSGPVDEAADPYSDNSYTSPAGLLPVRHTQDVYYLPARSSATDNDNIKTALQVYGAVYSAIHYTSTNFNFATNSYYYTGTLAPNHAIDIIGWDDNYPLSKFTPVAPGNGAFIAKNSWGTAWGSGGYFYISYYDTQTGEDNAVFTSETITNYDRVYQYDPYGWTSSMGFGAGDTGYFADVFTAVADESLVAVSFYTPQINSNYQISVNLDPTSGPINTTGPITMVTGTEALPGYHTVPLTTPIILKSGHKFSIAVRLQTPGYGYPISIEAPRAGYSSGATAQAGQSYLSTDGTSWVDLTRYYTNWNVNIKGFTKATNQAPNPIPVLSSISPSSATAGGTIFTLTVTGSNFVTGSVVRWNGADRTTTYISSTQLTASISPSDIAAAGTASVTVFNPLPGGGTSGALTFTINNPAPILTSISPSSAAAGGAPFTLNITGSNFIPDSKVQWNGVGRTTTYLSSTQLTVSIQASDIASAGTASVTVFNPSPGGGNSGTLTFIINQALNPAPTLTAISPSSTTAGGQGFTLIVTGSNFIFGSIVRWNGGDRLTNYVSPTQLTASILASDIASPGTASVTVFNPTPGGGTSGSMTFTINTPSNPAPSLSGISPSSTTAGGSAFTLTVTGSNFESSSTVQWNGQARTTTYLSSTRLTASILASDIASAGTASVTVFNPTPGGGTSNAATFTINPVATMPPTASFSGSPTSGKGPLTVQFTDRSTGNPTSWKWDFGDGYSSTQESPIHTYNSAGSFTVTLTVTNNAGSNTNQRVNYIKVRMSVSKGKIKIS